MAESSTESAPLSAAPLREFTIIIEKIIPPGVNLRDTTVDHYLRQSPPSYLLGYIVNPKAIYEWHKRNGKQRETEQETLDMYLACIKKNVGIEWGTGLQKETIDGEEHWLIFCFQSSNREHVLAIDRRLVENFRRVTRMGSDPMLIIYKHPKMRLLCFRGLAALTSRPPQCYVC
ncbi:uncharacterized protein SCHCODRAFT_02637847 [Schizophyllum commune H4-8]|nr:uncharacterized protein SCHCODRAFT_02637847 [Schizophyllum commune H4-8]KAI5888832.1 hypothetical protein SCHCODRAFT_02637847 [Schizophyllum commune H4-8]